MARARRARGHSWSNVRSSGHHVDVNMDVVVAVVAGTVGNANMMGEVLWTQKAEAAM
jgi:hypothetical protein